MKDILDVLESDVGHFVALASFRANKAVMAALLDPKLKIEIQTIAAIR